MVEVYQLHITERRIPVPKVGGSIPSLLIFLVLVFTYRRLYRFIHFFLVPSHCPFQIPDILTNYCILLDTIAASSCLFDLNVDNVSALFLFPLIDSVLSRVESLKHCIDDLTTCSIGTDNSFYLVKRYLIKSYNMPFADCKIIIFFRKKVNILVFFHLMLHHVKYKNQ